MSQTRNYKVNMVTRNRGKQSDDDKSFSIKWQAELSKAVDDIGYLLTRGYAEPSALQIVGNRYKLNKRQRNALMRVSSGDAEITSRVESAINSSQVENKIIEIDGFNILILLESALSGAFVFKSRDGTYRDVSSVHGSYKRVVKTEEAILLVGNTLKHLKVKSVKCYLDRPVSNSGSLKSKMMEISDANDFNWEVDLVFNPDKILSESKNIIVTSDGGILDNIESWFNLGAYVIEKHLKESNVIVL